MKLSTCIPTALLLASPALCQEYKQDVSYLENTYSLHARDTLFEEIAHIVSRSLSHRDIPSIHARLSPEPAGSVRVSSPVAATNRPGPSVPNEAPATAAEQAQQREHAAAWRAKAESDRRKKAAQRAKQLAKAPPKPFRPGQAQRDSIKERQKAAAEARLKIPQAQRDAEDAEKYAQYMANRRASNKRYKDRKKAEAATARAEAARAGAERARAEAARAEAERARVHALWQ